MTTINRRIARRGSVVAAWRLVMVHKTANAWPMLRRAIAQADLLDEMVRCLDIEPARAVRVDQGAAWRLARARCIACREDRTCRAWIREQTVSRRSPPPFCVNGAFFKQLL